MDEIRSELRALRGRLRLQMIVSAGVLAVAVMSMGGADAVARTLVEADVWTVSTKRLNGTDAPRLVVTGDTDIARIKVMEANIELAQQSTTPATTTAGALWYDSANGKLKYRNGSGWVEPGGSTPPPVGSSPAGVFGRLEITGTTSTQLDFKQFMGDYVDVNGQYVQIGAGKSLTPTGTTLLSTRSGAFSGVMAANATYSVYISNASATGAPSSLRASTLGPVLYNGVKYLNNVAADNGLHWRFVGWVRTNASNLFENSDTKRFVINYYNRRQLRLQVIQGLDTWTYTTFNVWRAWRGDTAATADRLETISNSEDPIRIDVTSTFRASATSGIPSAMIGVCVDNTNANHATVMGGPSVTVIGYAAYAYATYHAASAEGHHYFQLVELNNINGYVVTFCGDNGWTNGRLQSGAIGWVMG